MDITEATMRGGVSECLNATLHKKSIPTYVGVGSGLVLGNAVGKKLSSFYEQKFYSDYDNKILDDPSETPDRWVELGLRTVGRLVTSAAICAVSGSYEGDMKDGMKMAAVGSTGFVVIDIVRELGSDPDEATPSWIDDYLTLQGPVPTRRAVARAPQRAPQRATPRTAQVRPVALQGRPAMEAAALAPRYPADGKPMQETAALTSTSGASF